MQAFSDRLDTSLIALAAAGFKSLRPALGKFPMRCFFFDNFRPARLQTSSADRAAELDRPADAELQHGHVHAAEHLARLAADLRQQVVA